ncbi:MAG: AI-2E family transporter [Sphingopyxis sp.]|jgi:predicted PurR-regulated permease PerM|nr:AI-2E family transporter [Sphingopyxis sp.]
MSEAPGPNEMRDPFVRKELQRALIWLGLIVGLALIWLLAQPLLLILAGIVFATMLDGGARLLGRILPIGRGWRLAIVMLATVAFLGWVVTFAGSQLAGQAAQLQTVLLTQVERIASWAETKGFTGYSFDPEQALRYAMGSVGQVTQAVGMVLGGLTSLVMIMVLGIFFALEPRLYERGFAWLLPMGERAHFYRVTDAMGFTLRRLMAGRLLGMLVEGVATWLLLAAYDIPMAALLGIITGLLVFIPNIGAIISGVLMVLVGFSTGVEGGLYALGVYFAVQTIDGYIIVPMVARRTVDLAPALVLGAQLLFGALFGLLGLALADPIVALIKVALEKNAARGADKAEQSETAQRAATAPAAARIARRSRRAE